MIEVLEPGLLTTIQDEGRWGYQAFGMPVAGAMDSYAYQAANLLAGNCPGAAVLEMTLRGGRYAFKKDLRIALTGADMKAQIDGEDMLPWTARLVRAGSVLTLQFAVNGCRTYLAVRGGIEVPQVLGSRSTYVRGKVGGLDGRALQAGDKLQAGKESQELPVKNKLPAAFIPRQESSFSLRVLLGPQDDHFTPAGLTTFFGNEYKVTTEADRMGYRLEGPQVEHSGTPDIISDALCQGAVQIPGHGQPIIMLADRQTTGGYAKLGVVISPDLWRLAQAKPKDRLRFVQMSEKEAQQAYIQAKNQLTALQQALYTEPVSTGKNYRVKVNGSEFQVRIEEVLSNEIH